MLKDPENPALEEAAIAYLLWAATQQEQYSWAAELPIELAMTQQWHTLWRFVRAALAEAPENDDWSLGTIASGPLEDLLAYAGEQFIDAVEQESGVNPKFARAVTGVWRNQMSDEIWARVQALAATVPNPVRMDSPSHPRDTEG